MAQRPAGIIFETLFGLIASTGLRISEALSLKNADVDLKTGMLRIHLTKFGIGAQSGLREQRLTGATNQ